MENEKKIKEIDTDFLEEDARKRFFGQGGVDELIDLLDDEDETEYKKWENLRDIASDKYDFTGFDHVNCYDKKNFLAGTLEALERTRRRLSISTAEKLIDFLFVFGYSLKRIIYILYCQGYVDWFGRDVQNYINRNRFRIRKILLNVSVTRRQRLYRYRAVSSSWRRLFRLKLMKKTI